MGERAPSSGGLHYMKSASQSLKQSIGTEQCWGWSPAFDLLQHLPEAVRRQEDQNEPINVLIDSAGDIRHILMTISRQHRHTQRPVHFYVYEPNLKHHSRHLFFLEWFFEQKDVSALDESSAEFLELFANVMLRDTAYSTLKRVSKKASALARGEKSALEDHVDLETFVKLREVDWIAEQLDAWHQEASTFNVDYQWDNRVRADLGDRYDSKHNLMDWDFNSGLLSYTPHVRWPEYKDWRTSGIAFDWGRVNPKKNTKYEYTQPNKSLAVFADRKRSIGTYNGDVRCGPYPCFGIDTEWKDLRAKQQDGTFKYSNGVIALHTIRAWLYELMTGEEWEYSEFKLAWDAPEYKQVQKITTLPADPVKVPKFKYIGMGLDPARMHLQFKTKYTETLKFDAMFLSCTAAQNFTEERAMFLKDEGYLVVESLKFCVYMEAKQKAAFVEKVTELVQACGWEKACALEKKLHQYNPPHHLPFARNENPVLTPSQQKVCWCCCV